MKNFGAWLLEELEKRDMSQSDLSRASGITTAQMSRIISGDRNAGKNTLSNIARALKIPAETVFRAAGLLPPQSPETELINRIIHLTSDLPDEDQADILEYIMLRTRLAEERGKYETKGTGKSATKFRKA